MMTVTSDDIAQRIFKYTENDIILWDEDYRGGRISQAGDLVIRLIGDKLDHQLAVNDLWITISSLMLDDLYQAIGEQDTRRKIRFIHEQLNMAGFDGRIKPAEVSVKEIYKKK